MIGYLRVLMPLALVLSSLGKEITRDHPDDVEAAQTTVAIPSTDERFKEEIKNQLKALNRMKCKPVHQKVFTYEHIGEDQEYQDAHLYDIFPEVLSVTKCDENCSYCNPRNVKVDGQRRKKGMLEAKSCQATSKRVKNYAIRATDKETGKVSYFHIQLENDTQCECRFKTARRHRHGHGSA